MFQYAAARALAECNNMNVVLDLSWFNQEFDTTTTTPRHYELACFRLGATTEKYRSTTLQNLRLRRVKKYTEPHFHYDPNYTKLPKSTVLSGYFQSEKYFSDIRGVLLEDFSWAKEPKGKNKDNLKQIKNDPSSVSVHVRRGDYVSNENAAKFHGLTGVDYYKAAVKEMTKHVKNPNLYVFSDDPDWCKKNIKFTQQTIYVSHNTDGSEDMRLMKACRHNIIANSSFSWWGAWLNENSNKIVIAPNQWFSHSESNTKDIIPGSWHKL
jgi:hypothetical protein